MSWETNGPAVGITVRWTMLEELYAIKIPSLINSAELAVQAMKLGLLPPP